MNTPESKGIIECTPELQVTIFITKNRSLYQKAENCNAGVSVRGLLLYLSPLATLPHHTVSLEKEEDSQEEATEEGSTEEATTA